MRPLNGHPWPFIPVVPRASASLKGELRAEQCRAKQSKAEQGQEQERSKSMKVETGGFAYLVCWVLLIQVCLIAGNNLWGGGCFVLGSFSWLRMMLLVLVMMGGGFGYGF